MSNLPFGFSSGDDDGDRKKDDDASNSGANNPFGFGGGFDSGSLGAMISQFGQMLTGMGGAITSGGTGPVNYQLAAQIARRQIGSVTPITEGRQSAAEEAVRLAELWLDDASSFPAGATKAVAWTPIQWLDSSMPTWQRLCDPIAEKLADLAMSNMPEEAKQMLGPMAGMFTQMGSVAFGSQLGNALGQLAKEVLTGTDIGLPLGPEATATLLPQAIAAFAEGIEQPEREALVFLAAREAAYQRLYVHVPWLRGHVLSTVEDYARGIEMDFSGIEEAMSGIDPASLMDPSTLSDPSKLEGLLSGGVFEPKDTPAQQAALGRLELLLALVEGWVEYVVATAVGERLPGASALTETMRRRRASGGPAEQTFATLVGLQLRPRKVREAATLWQRLTDAVGAERRDAVWAHPDLLPGADELDNPAAFIDRILSADDELDDPIAALEKQFGTDPADPDASDSDDQNPSDPGSDPESGTDTPNA